MCTIRHSAFVGFLAASFGFAGMALPLPAAASSGLPSEQGSAVGVNRTVSAMRSLPWFRDLYFPGGAYVNCVKTRDTSPLIPSVVEWKYYAPGVGLVLEVERDEEAMWSGTS